MRHIVNQEEMIGLRDAQRILKIGRNTMHDLVKSGKIPAKKVGNEWKILGKNLMNWLEANNKSTESTVGFPNHYHSPNSREQAIIGDWT